MADYPPQPQSSGPPVLKIACFGCLALLIFSGLCCVGMVAFTFQTIKASQPYKDAITKAQADTRVVAAIGVPQEEWWAGGNVQIMADGSGIANLLVPVKGPKGSGMINIVGAKNNGKWTYSQIEFVDLTNGGPPIDILAGEDGDKGDGDKGDGDKKGEEVSASPTPAATPAGR